MTADGPPRKAGGGRLGLLIAAAVLAAAWIGFLVWLAVRTANPVTVNRAQLVTSDAVVIATVEPTQASSRSVSLRIEKVLAGQLDEETLRVGGVEPGRFSAGGRFLVPLRETDHGFVVTLAPVTQEGVPLVYPATDDALRAAEKILATGTDKPYE